MGRLDSSASARRWSFKSSASGASSVPCRNLFYDPDTVHADPSDSGHVPYMDRKEGSKAWWPFGDTGSDRFHSHPRRHGKPGRRGRCYFFWRCRCCILDVDCTFLVPATASVEATLAQLHKQKDPLYGGYRGGPAYYIHDWIQSRRKTPRQNNLCIAVLFALSGLICWCGISQVIGNSVTAAFHNAFAIPPIIHNRCAGASRSSSSSSGKMPP